MKKLIAFALSIAAATMLSGCIGDDSEEKVEFTETKELTVVKMKKPKRFSLEAIDSDGRTYTFLRKRCGVYEKYQVGSKHNIKIVKTMYINKDTNKEMREATYSLKDVCQADPKPDTN